MAKEIFGEKPKFTERLTINLNTERSRFVDFPESVERMRILAFEIPNGLQIKFEVGYKPKVPYGRERYACL